MDRILIISSICIIFAIWCHGKPADSIRAPIGTVLKDYKENSYYSYEDEMEEEVEDTTKSKPLFDKASLMSPPVLVDSFVDNANSIEKISQIYPVIFGSTVRLQCKFVGHPSNTNYTWYINDKIVTQERQTSGERIYIQLIQRKQSQLTLEHIIDDDQANYTCVAKNPFGQRNFTYNLKVIMISRVKPIISSNSINQTVLVGSSIALECKHHSSSGVSYQWFRVFNATNYTKIYSPSLTLRLVNLTENDSGNYTCLLKNQFGMKALSHHITVITLGDHPKDRLKIILLATCAVLLCLWIGYQLIYCRRPSTFVYVGTTGQSNLNSQWEMYRSKQRIGSMDTEQLRR